MLCLACLFCAIAHGGVACTLPYPLVASMGVMIVANKPKKKVGRKSLMTDDTVREFLEVIQDGFDIREACDHVGVAERTVYEWIQIGEAHMANQPHDRMPHKLIDRERFAQFALNVKKAKVDAHLWHLRNIKDKAKDDGKLSAWYLAHKYPHIYGTKQMIQIEGKIKISMVNELVMSLEKAGLDPNIVLSQLLQFAKDRIADNNPLMLDMSDDE